MSTQADVQVVMIPVGKLLVDPEVNTRPLTPTRAERIAKNLDFDLLGVLHVSSRSDGSYAVIDGQHRAHAVKLARGDREPVPCIVHKRIRTHRQAALFVGLNDSHKVPPLYNFTGRVNAREPVATAIAEVCALLGITIDSSPKDHHVRCVGVLERLHGMGGAEPRKFLYNTIQVAVDAWGATTAALRGEVLEGIGLVLQRHGDRVDLTVLVSKLTSIQGGPGGLVGTAKSTVEYRGGKLSQAVAGTIVAVYNKGRRKNLLPDWWAGA